MSTLILGNSHAAALATAYFEQKPDIDLKFLAIAGGMLLPNLKIDGDRQLYSDRMEVQKHIRERDLEGVSLNSFDNIIVFGCQLRSSGAGADWIQKIKSTEQFYSAQVARQSHLDHLSETAHYQFLQRLQKTPLESHVKLFSVPSPYPNEMAPFAEGLDGIKTDDVAEIIAVMASEIEALGSTFVDTPDALLSENGLTTHRKFKIDRDDDVAHLNADGGTVMLDLVERVIQGEFTS